MKRIGSFTILLLLCFMMLFSCAQAADSFYMGLSSKTIASISIDGFMQEILDHMLSTVTVFGLVLPMYFIWFAALIILIIIILIIVAAARKNKASDDDTIAPSIEVDKNIPTVKSVKFMIQYNGNVEIRRCEIDGTLRIGREMTTLPLNPDDHAISRKHCELYYLNDVLMLRDFSYNGTTVNDNLCNHSEQIINSGDTLIIGEHKITVTF